MRFFGSSPKRLNVPLSLLIAGAGLFFGPVAAEFQTAQASTERKLIRLHNKERKKRNRPKLRRSGTLDTAARKYARVMANTGHFSHTGPPSGFPDIRRADQERGIPGKNLR